MLVGLPSPLFLNFLKFIRPFHFSSQRSPPVTFPARVVGSRRLAAISLIGARFRTSVASTPSIVCSKASRSEFSREGSDLCCKYVNSGTLLPFLGFRAFFASSLGFSERSFVFTVGKD